MCDIKTLMRTAPKIVQLTQLDHATTLPTGARASVAEVEGVSATRRVWRSHGLKSHLIKIFKVLRDPKFVKKLEDIMGLYLHPPGVVEW